MGGAVILASGVAGHSGPSQHFYFSEASGAKAVREALALQTFERLVRSYDLVIIDHDHRLSCLVEQYNLSRCLAHPDSTFTFDDAVPRSLDMTGEVATQTWWVGQVWLLSQILRPLLVDSFLATTDVGPTGALVAHNCAPITQTDVAEAFLRRGQPSDLGDITSLFVHQGLDIIVGLNRVQFDTDSWSLGYAQRYSYIAVVS